MKHNTKRMIRTHRKNDNQISLSLHNNSKIKSNLESAEGLVDEDVLDGGCGDETGC
jgi:hypothetical protein